MWALVRSSAALQPVPSTTFTAAWSRERQGVSVSCIFVAVTHVGQNSGFSKHTSEDDFTGGDAVVVVYHKKKLVDQHSHSLRLCLRACCVCDCACASLCVSVCVCARFGSCSGIDLRPRPP